MSDREEGTELALLVLAGVVALVVGAVLVLAVSRAGAPAPRGGTSAAVAAMAAGDAPDVRIDFEPGSDALPPGASDALAGLADAARRQDGTAVLITGFRGGGSDGALDADLARRREGAVRHALEADGVAPERLVMDEPVAASGAAQAHRVELRLR